MCVCWSTVDSDLEELRKKLLSTKSAQARIAAIESFEERGSLRLKVWSREIRCRWTQIGTGVNSTEKVSYGPRKRTKIGWKNSTILKFKSSYGLMASWNRILQLSLSLSLLGESDSELEKWLESDRCLNLIRLFLLLFLWYINCDPKVPFGFESLTEKFSVKTPKSK